jgi:CrcB protein
LFGLIAVFIGGGIGASLRYLISTFAGNFALTYQGTFLINIIGCLFLGFVSYIALKKENKFNPDLKLFLTTGIAGGFTTFSTFCNEIFKMLQTGQMFTGCLYLFFSVSVGLLAASLGVFLAKQVLLFRFESKLVDRVKS